MLTAMTIRSSPVHRTAVTHGGAAASRRAADEVGTRLRRLDAGGLRLRTAGPGKAVSVYASSPEVVTALTALVRTGRSALPQLDWTLEFSPVETVLILTGTDDVLAGLGLVASYQEQAAGV